MKTRAQRALDWLAFRMRYSRNGFNFAQQLPLSQEEYQR